MKKTKVEIKDYNVTIDGKNFSHKPVRFPKDCDWSKR